MGEKICVLEMIFFFTHKPFSYRCMREKITGLRWNWALGAARTQICNFEAKAV